MQIDNWALLHSVISPLLPQHSKKHDTARVEGKKILFTLKRLIVLETSWFLHNSHGFFVWLQSCREIPPYVASDNWDFERHLDWSSFILNWTSLLVGVFGLASCFHFSPNFLNWPTILFRRWCAIIWNSNWNRIVFVSAAKRGWVKRVFLAFSGFAVPVLQWLIRNLTV